MSETSTATAPVAGTATAVEVREARSLLTGTMQAVVAVTGVLGLFGIAHIWTIATGEGTRRAEAALMFAFAYFLTVTLLIAITAALKALKTLIALEASDGAATPPS